MIFKQFWISLLMGCFNLAFLSVARRMWNFWWIEVGSSACSNVGAFLELSSFDIFLSVSIVQPSRLFASLKPSHRNDCFHPGIAVEVLWKKAFFKIVDCLIFGILMMAFFCFVFIDKELIFLALILELIADLWLIMFVLVSALRL